MIITMRHIFAAAYIMRRKNAVRHAHEFIVISKEGKSN